MKSKEGILRHPLWSNVLGGLAVAGLLAIGGYLLDWWPSVRGVTIVTLEWLEARTETPNWVLCLLSIPTAGFLFLIGAGIWYKINPETAHIADAQWTDYTKDRIFGLVWRWCYVGGVIEQLVSFCPHCDYQVYPSNASGFAAVDRITFKCESCGRQLGTFDESVSYFESRVKRTIQQKLRNDDWKTIVETGNTKDV